jgi:GT2 family glycosyltransferase
MLSLIIPAWNALEYTKLTVESARSKSQLEIIIVDNGSSDGTADWAEDEGLTVIRNEVNKGREQAHNQGIRKAMELGCDLFLFAHNDVLFHKDAIDNLVKAFEGSKGKYASLSSITQIAYGQKHHVPSELMGSAGGSTYLYTENPPLANAVELLDNLPLPPFKYGRWWGCVLFILNAETLERVGWFDENYSMIVVANDDFIHRCNIAKWETGCVSNSLVFHFNTKSTVFNKIEPYRNWQIKQSMRYFIQKWGVPPKCGIKYARPFNGEPVPARTWDSIEGGTTNNEELEIWAKVRADLKNTYLEKGKPVPKGMFL